MAAAGPDEAVAARLEWFAIAEVDITTASIALRRQACQGGIRR